MNISQDQRISPAQRWFALLLVILNIGFNYFQASYTPDSKSIRDVSAEYTNLFMPAPYAFSIWGIIYVAVLIYAVIQVLPGQKDQKAYNELAFPLSFLSILSMCWVLSFTNEIIILSEIIIIAMLITSIYGLVVARRFAGQGQLGKWAVVPFSLYAGWLSVATIANTAVWLVSIGYDGGKVGPQVWAELMLGVAVILGIVVSFRFKDIVYPIVIAWGIVAIWADWNTSKVVALCALSGGVLLLLAAIINIVRLEHVHPRVNRKHHHRGI